MKKRLLGASATLALTLVLGATPAAADCDPATHAVQYLHGQQMADGSVGSIGQTADFVLGAAADGIDPRTMTAAASGKSAFDLFATDLSGAQKALVDANSLGKMIQAVVAGHLDPKSFGGLNLLDRLRNGSTPGANPHAFYDSATGIFFDSAAPNNQTYTQANAILGLAAANDAGFKVPPAAVTELQNLQTTSGVGKGGWPTYGGDDSNGTSMAMMALLASGRTPATDPAVYADAFAFLLGVQDASSGGFSYCSVPQGAFCDGISDPQSDSLTIQALVAAGENPAGPKWANSKGNATADLLGFQDPASGGFAFAHGLKPQAFATTQAVPGLLRAPFPILGTFVPGAVLPAAGCVPASAAPAGQVGAAQTTPTLPLSGHPATAPRSALVGWFPGAAPLLVAVSVLACLGAGPHASWRRRRLRR
jgi:hypothetical protein